jgi:tetratricopeptide (TPR) repeat protein
VLDNLESVLPSSYGVQSIGFSRNASDAEPLQVEAGTLNAVSESDDENNAAITEIFNLCRDLLRANPAARLLFTTREPLPEPFNHRHREITLGALSREDAIELVGEVMRREGLTPKHDDAGNSPQEIIDLVEAVNRHARALTLMAREISRSGVRATTGDLRRLMAKLQAEHPGDRENSLYASVELSLRRLPPGMRDKIKPLALFHGGANLMILSYVLNVDKEALKQMAQALIEVGLAEMMDYGHLRLDPALPNHLLGQMSAAEQEQARSRWAEGMRELARLLHQQHFQDAQLAAQLTLLELPNLLALIEWAQGALMPEEMVGLSGNLETLLARLGRPQALAQATRVREHTAQALGAWSQAQFESLRQGIDRMLGQGRLPEAKASAEKLLDRALSAGEAAYSGAPYDIAAAHFLFGRTLRKTGAAEAALTPLNEARRRFQALADAGYINAERAASNTISEAAGCLLHLGRYDEAAADYEEGIRGAEKLGDQRGTAVTRGNLGTVRLYQKRYGEALESFKEALGIFESLGEPDSVGIGWHQIGMAHREAGQFERAEQAYRKSLAIKVQRQERSGEAASLNELGILYRQMGRLEEAATLHRQAADIYTRFQDQRSEGGVRNNLANTLIGLQRYGEARRELRRGFECIKPFGHAAEPWKAWSILHDLEQATGDAQAAEAARRQAIDSYLAYRRAGGESQSYQAELFTLVFHAIEQGAATEAEQYLDEWSEENDSLRAKTLIAKLQCILRGDRAPALAADPNLDYCSAVELELLLEALEKK